MRAPSTCPVWLGGTEFAVVILPAPLPLSELGLGGLERRAGRLLALPQGFDLRLQHQQLGAQAGQRRLVCGDLCARGLERAADLAELGTLPLAQLARVPDVSSVRVTSAPIS